MPDPTQDLKDKIRGLAHGDPMMQIGDLMAQFGEKVQDTYYKAKGRARQLIDSAEKAIGVDEESAPAAKPQETPQGTTKGTAPKTPRKRLKRISVNPSTNGGYVVKHTYHPEYGGTPAPDTHVFTDKDALDAHLASMNQTADSDA